MARSGTIPSRILSLRPLPLRVYLFLLCLFAFAPVAIYTSVVLRDYAQMAREQNERRGIEDVREIADAIDQDIVMLTTVLETLASSTRIPAYEFSAFHRLASQVSNGIGLHVALADVSGQQIVNTRLPYGTPLPHSSISFDRVLAEKRPVVNDLFKGVVAKTWLYSLNVPVFSPWTDNVTHVLGITVDPQRLHDIMIRSGLQEHALALVIDRNGRIMARNYDHQQRLGMLHPFLPDEADLRQEGQVRQINLDGVEMQFSFKRAKTTGWIIAHGMPVEIVDAPLRLLKRQLIVGGIATALISLLAAIFISRRITVALGALRDAAENLSLTGLVPHIETAVREVNHVGEALGLASHRLGPAQSGEMRH